MRRENLAFGKLPLALGGCRAHSGGLHPIIAELSLADELRRGACVDTRRLDILEDGRSRTNNCISTDCHTRANEYIGRNPSAFFDADGRGNVLKTIRDVVTAGAEIRVLADD